MIGAHALLKMLMYLKYIPLSARLFTPLTLATDRKHVLSNQAAAENQQTESFPFAIFTELHTALHADMLPE
ncbi:hypothetical protein ACO0LM_26245 [Undibacterium sp. Di26W]|uniref:hypothetical protein n=1 Tax=Undibacterium sp. Di26W TaxID=3413035 RepID=UPI003BF419A2